VSPPAPDNCCWVANSGGGWYPTPSKGWAAETHQSAHAPRFGPEIKMEVVLKLARRRGADPEGGELDPAVDVRRRREQRPAAASWWCSLRSSTESPGKFPEGPNHPVASIVWYKQQSSFTTQSPHWDGDHTAILNPV